MKSIAISVGYEHDNTYFKLHRVLSRADFADMYKEDIQEKYPYLFYDNSSVKNIHVSISDKGIIEKLLQISEKYISVGMFSTLELSLLWHFPRKQYSENLTWLCLSGFFYVEKAGGIVVSGKNFVVSNNLVNDHSSKIADKIVEYINGCL